MYNDNYYLDRYNSERYLCPFNCPYFSSQQRFIEYPCMPMELKDYGPQPFVIDISEAAKQNNNYRTTIWTGNHLQVTLMSINVGDDIGLEVHPTVDQFLRIEEGNGIVRMGKSKGNLNFEAKASNDFAIMVPAGTWHNVINTGNIPLKLYSIYAPPQHPYGTINITK
jgi:mannose-6-phosphate isomerase-like protein (cupin superfamily)